MSSIPEFDGSIVPVRVGVHFTRPDIRTIRRAVGGFLSASLKSLAMWQAKRASRRILRDLTDAELEDIGVTRAEARAEVSKSFFWD
ncbi:DUF1127 domain-containing protein [Rhizobium sp. S152]|uniref:DUF1127 domain-containing protein n=1 Tax=Rhizobium sp. S152 TaxID=3055038 RepID=UPI0025A935CF|nr:DUF1127 domain-containing protein [Rhizobium sp. S152]MDM9628231.1 DUF1127 domain-containing protein [Rhizobium sp. S152]